MKATHLGQEGSVQATQQRRAPSDEELPTALFDHMVEYGKLLDELKVHAIDDATFNRRAVSIGLIVREYDAWILDLNTQRWWRYDGMRLCTPVSPDESERASRKEG